MHRRLWAKQGVKGHRLSLKRHGEVLNGNGESQRVMGKR